MIMIQFSNSNNVVEVKNNHYRKSMHSKSQASRVYFFRKVFVAFLSVSIIFNIWSCDDKVDKIPDEDICVACSQSPLHTLEEGVLIVTSKIVTPNGDGINDFFEIRIIAPDEEDLLIPDFSIIIYDGSNKQIATFSQYLYENSWQVWDCRVNGKDVKNGLYSYKLTVNEKEMEGNFLIARCLEQKSMDFSNNSCFDECLKYQEWLNFNDPCIY